MGKHRAPRPLTQRYAEGQRIQGHNLPLGIQEILLDQVKQWDVWAGIIKTSWYNALDDNHATLDKKLYINELIPHTKKWEQLICCP